MFEYYNTAPEIHFAFRGRLVSLLELRSAGSHRGLSSRWSYPCISCAGSQAL